MKRLLGSGAFSRTAPPPVEPNTSLMKFENVCCWPAASVITASFFVPVESKRLAVIEKLDDVGFKIAT